MEFDTNILDILNSLPLRTLRKFAEANGLSIADDASKERIISELQSNCPGVVRDKIRGAFLIDVDVIGKDLNDELKKAVETQVAHGMKGVDGLKVLIGTITGIFGLFILVGTGYTTVKIASIDSDLKARDADLTALEKKAGLFVNEQRALAEAYASHTIRRILPGITETLLNFSLSNVEPPLAEELRDFHETLTDFDAAHAIALPDESPRMRQIQESVVMLKSLVDALVSFEELKKLPEDEKLKRIPDVVSAWKGINIPDKPTSDAFGVFAKRLVVFRSNVLGVLVFMRSKNAPTDRKKEGLDEADKYFKDALIEADKIGFNFTRPLSNQGLVLSERIGLLPSSDTAGRYALFRKSQEKYARALEDEASDKRKSLLYNNQASTFQDEALYDSERGARTKARKSLQSAEASLKLALDLNGVHPAVYSTLAELKAQALLLDLEDNKQPAFQERKDEIVGMVKKAIRFGYMGWRGKTTDAFFRSSPVLDRLRREDAKQGGGFYKQIDDVFLLKRG